MSWNLFGQSQEALDKQWKLQKMETEHVAKTLHRLSEKCYTRCAQNVNKPELSTAEMLCLDRCTTRFILTINTASLRTDELAGKYGPIGNTHS